MDNTHLRHERTHSAIGQAATEHLHPEGFRLSFAWGLARRTHAKDLEGAKAEAVASAENSGCRVSLLDGATYKVIGEAKWSAGDYNFTETP